MTGSQVDSRAAYRTAESDLKSNQSHSAALIRQLRKNARCDYFMKKSPENRITRQEGRLDVFHRKVYGTMKGPMKGADGKEISPTNKSFEVEFCTVAHWKDGEIVEERLFLRPSRIDEADRGDVRAVVVHHLRRIHGLG